MSTVQNTQSKPFTPRPAAAHHEHHETGRNFGEEIAMVSGALGAAIALVGAALWSLQILVAASLLLGAGAFLKAANHKCQ